MPLIIATEPAPEPSLNSAPRCISSDSISFQWMLLLRWSLNIAESTFWCFLLTVLFQFVFCINHCIKVLIFNIVFKPELNPYRKASALRVENSVVIQPVYFCKFFYIYFSWTSQLIKLITFYNASYKTH